MNMKLHKSLINKLKYKLEYLLRLLDTKPISNSFSSNKKNDTINRIYVINLDRKPSRWKQVKRELNRVSYNTTEPLINISRRFSAIDARYFNGEVNQNNLIPYYTLSDQLKVEPNDKVPANSDFLLQSIKMTPQEIAIALSHIEVWKLIAQSSIPYTLVLEDDVFFKFGFAKNLDATWKEILELDLIKNSFDILYLSYDEVGQKNKKQCYPEIIRKPKIGIWQASGYILSLKGALKLLDMLPVYGPIDLWLNLKFEALNVYLTKEPIIEQRFDIPSTNSYSIMPLLSRIGVHTEEKPLLIQKKNLNGPVFGFGTPDSGLTSLALALSILGYTCCSDISKLPETELRILQSKNKKNYFNAYINIGSLDNLSISELIKIYPNAKFIYTIADNNKISSLDKEKFLYLPSNHFDKWELLCSFLKCEYPSSSYPVIDEIGQRKLDKKRSIYKQPSKYKKLKYDKLPWIIDSFIWMGIKLNEGCNTNYSEYKNVLNWSGKYNLDTTNWKIRNDTFPSNLSLFDPNNVQVDENRLIHLNLKEYSSTVRSFSSAALTTQKKYLYGKFSVELKPSNISGLITGVFLHRNSPHQEIDIEFLGKDTTKILVNVFYNPGIDGTKLEYGYRGTPILINLGFDASKDFHEYSFEWNTDSIRWSVDGNVIYERVLWNPTPIPNLPMEFNVNLWHSKSVELAGKLRKTNLPAQSIIKSINIWNNIDN